MNECANQVKLFADLILDFSERFAQKKREKNIIDFHDLEHIALGILREERNTEAWDADEIETVSMDELYPPTNAERTRLILVCSIQYTLGLQQRAALCFLPDEFSIPGICIPEL